MEFAFEINHILPGRITVIESKDSFSGLKIFDLESGQDSDRSWTYNLSSNTPWDIKVKRRKEDLENIIDLLGNASAQAQNLNIPITTLKKLINSCQQKIYVIRDTSAPRCIIGFLKVGVKRLFVRDSRGASHEVDPLCVLDFYIHESKQRCGFGHELFNAILQAEQISPEQLAVDRPSYKCLAFLQKHYGLSEPRRQNNNFVIFPGFLPNNQVRSKPPIFLYNESMTSEMNTRFSRQAQSSPSKCSDKDSVIALSPVQVPISSREIKSKSMASSAGNCLLWNDAAKERKRSSRATAESSSLQLKCKTGERYAESNSEIQERIHDTPPSDKQYHSWQRSNCMDWNKKEKDWNSYESSVPRQSSYVEHCNKKHQDICANGKGQGVYEAMHQYSDTQSGKWNENYSALTPLDDMSPSNRMKWNHLQSSWNILGVKPNDYFLLQRKA